MSESEMTHLTMEKHEPKPNAYEVYVMPCLAEFVGLLIFAFIGTMVTGYVTPAGNMWLLSIALAHGFTIALLIVAVGHISGGHLNPAVTLGITIAGGVTWLQGICYVISQLLGAMVGAAFTRAILPNATYAACAGGTHAIGGEVSITGAILCESILTMILVLTVLLAAVDPSSAEKALPPLAIGLAVLVGILAGGPFSGASMNPARAFGPAVAAGVWKNHYVWWVGPIIGGLVAGIIYRMFLADAERRLIAGNYMKRYI
ncbi:aquaporin-8-like isoform X5 [Branchiostoma floridae]|uniref:Aquaporin-8-like isoform X5 n=2 Tax=Branchiostoma floridae TaxID=7739 RepID=A0A9J7MA75_BRAFL|nr:aquaporin-8-like isoform X5 [Branchiostoma floridae]